MHLCNTARIFSLHHLLASTHPSRLGTLPLADVFLMSTSHLASLHIPILIPPLLLLLSLPLTSPYLTSSATNHHYNLIPPPKFIYSEMSSSLGTSHVKSGSAGRAALPKWP